MSAHFKSARIIRASNILFPGLLLGAAGLLGGAFYAPRGLVVPLFISGWLCLVAFYFLAAHWGARWYGGRS